ncbi:GerAB/ArcD/ProY family transporter [Anaeromicrobium sediminis]|uniref:Spore gernimation protein n=1 Tax=Anaeromicrobium sediminis TaxID=1478221 RepID=A0A267MC13_9FIRM|nr:endospore germination permease [Anaeromicrobium sediminis]PAB56350.1 spore gernimation protein [Anaeromicrobium sediminis]
MFNNWKISPHQFEILVVMCFIGTSILFSPVDLATTVKQDAWLGAIAGNILGLFLVCLYNAVGNYFSNMTLIEYAESVLGKWLGKTLSLLYFSFLFINCSMILWIAGDFITTQITPEAPIQFTNTLFVLIVIMGTRLGLETFARAAEVLYPFVIGLLIILMIFVLPDIESKNIQPVFEYGIKPMIKGGLFYSSLSSLTLIPLMMIFPAHVNNLKEAKKSFLRGTLLGGFVIFLIVTLCILVLGQDMTARNAFPSYALAKKINIGNIIQRIEAIIAIIWFITTFYKMLLHFYGATLGLAQILNLKDYRPLTLPLGMILVVLSLVVFPNVTYAGIWNTTTWLPYVLTYGFFLPLLLLIVSLFRKSKKRI